MSKETNDYLEPMTKNLLKKMKPMDALNRLVEGNKRFLKGKGQAARRDLKKYLKETERGQNPFAIILSCVDSRIPTEIVFDQYIGDMFNARVAGNFVNEDILGSMEFAAQYVKLIVVMGHTSCGAIGAAHSAVYPPTEKNKKNCENIPAANLGQMVDKLIPSVLEAARNAEKPGGKERPTVDEVAAVNVKRTIENIRTRSQTPLRKLHNKGKIMIVGAMYNVKTGQVDFLEN